MGGFARYWKVGPDRLHIFSSREEMTSLRIKTLPNRRGFQMPMVVDYKPSHGDDDYVAVVIEASRRLARDFGLRLQPEHFRQAWERAAKEPHLAILDEPVVPDDETDEQLVLRIFVMASVHDEVFTAGSTALRVIQCELAAMSPAPTSDEIDAALERVEKAVREKFSSLDLGGWAPGQFQPVEDYSAVWARRLAEKVFGAARECGREAAGASLRMTSPVPGERGRPIKSALQAFGVELAKQWLSKRFPDGPSTEWSRCVSLIWVVAGRYEFGYGTDGQEDAAADATSEDLEEGKLDRLLDRAYRQANDALRKRYRAMLVEMRDGPHPM